MITFCDSSRVQLYCVRNHVVHIVSPDVQRLSTPVSGCPRRCRTHIEQAYIWRQIRVVVFVTCDEHALQALFHAANAFNGFERG